ncbi:MAG: hypothetical protein KAV87_14420 [Desulfobacteraceae bacterium]|nr:hypothetical protein [Desulfobacteraceae bacterium]
MDRRNVILTLLVVMCCTSMVWAVNDAAYYIKMGRLAMFEGEGSLSGLRMAYQTFDNGINDSVCPDCSDSEELKFLHAVTGTAMLFIDNSNVLVEDSFLELVQQFGVIVTGDSFDPSDTNPIDINVILDVANNYIVPSGAPLPEEIPGIIIAMIPQIDALIAELESIDDSPSDPFRIFFTPSETGMQSNLEVDYGEVLILKGLLMALKAQIQAKLAYDVYINVNESLLNKLLYVDGINTDNFDENTFFALFGIDDVDNLHINDDILNPYPVLLEVLPTDGAAILAKARLDMIVGIKYYSDAIDYLRNEQDPQENDFLYIDQDSEAGFQLVGDWLTKLRNSLTGGTAGTYMWETTKTYNIYMSGQGLVGELVLVYDFTGFDGDTGSLTFTDPSIAPSPWEVDGFWKEDNGIIDIDLEYYSNGDWRQGYLEGTLTPDENTIINATFEYWGTVNDKLTNLTGTWTSTEVTYKDINLNPIFVFPGPVSPRDMLPEFNDFNEPVYGTFGHGLGDDPTLKGILPSMTQQDWALLFDLSPIHPADKNDDYVVDDFELLDYIDLWADGQVGDFDLLDTIDLWAEGHY